MIWKLYPFYCPNDPPLVFTLTLSGLGIFFDFLLSSSISLKRTFYPTISLIIR